MPTLYPIAYAIKQDECHLEAANYKIKSTNYQGQCNSSHQSRTTRRGVNKTNIGKPVMKLSHELSTSRHNSINPGDFRFPPVTPRITRSPGWKIGSGFEGISLEPLRSTTLTSRRRTAKRSKIVRFANLPMRSLELSCNISPTIKGLNSRKSQRASNSSSTLLESTNASESTGNQVPSPQSGELIRHTEEINASETQSLALSLLSRADVGFLGGPGTDREKHFLQCPPLGFVESPSLQESENVSPAIRCPSRSERNGWLKRRGRFSFAREDEQRIFQVAQNRQSKASDKIERLLEVDEIQWFHEAQAGPHQQDRIEAQNGPVKHITSPQLHVTSPSLPMDIQNPRVQPDPELLDLGRYEKLTIANDGLDASKYFSNAVENLRSPAKGQHNVARRKSQMQNPFCENQFQVQPGALELGITPRLRRNLSSVPFRPPFKDL